jgi:hypothetical protein
MPPSMLRWVFHSPLRLTGVCCAVAGILVGGVLLAVPQPQQDTHVLAHPVVQPRPVTPTPAPPEPTSTPSETVGTRERTGVTTASREFVNAWARHEHPTPRPRWLRTIEPLTTGSLYRGLRATDPARLPRGHAHRMQLEQVGAFGATTVVTLTGGLQVQLQLVTEHGHWVVANIRPVGP